MVTVTKSRPFEAEIVEVKTFLAQFNPTDQRRFLALFRNIDKYLDLILSNGCRNIKQEDLSSQLSPEMAEHAVKSVLEQNSESDAGVCCLEFTRHYLSEQIKQLLLSKASDIFMECLLYNLEEYFVTETGVD